jgi:hypothetical protein
MDSTTSHAAATPVTVGQFALMLGSRKCQLTFTDTGSGWSLSNVVKPLPVDQVAAILHKRYDAGAPLTVEMINEIDWLHSDETTDFRNCAVENDNIPGQLVAVLKGSAMPELHRDYAFSNMASACKSCVKYTPECQRAMKPAW